MRNLRPARTGRSALVAAVGFLCLCMTIGATSNGGGGGCASDRNAQPAAAPNRPAAPVAATSDLNAGYAALSAGQYDQAMATAQQYLAAHPNGARGTAEAQYLQGRVYEARAEQAGKSGNPPAVSSNLQAARDAYVKALSASPAPRVEVLAQMGVANVAHFQDDYPTALARWTSALQKIDTLPPAEQATLANEKAFALYRLGLAQQRLGQFAEADTTFARVQQQFPGTDPAQRAGTHLGARSFQVQVGTFADANNANALMSALSAQGYASTRSPDSAGRQVVRVGPFPTYDVAKAVRKALAARYPDVTIVP